MLHLSRAPAISETVESVPLPAGWSWQRASEVCSMVSSGSTPKASDMYSDEGEIPFIKVYNIGTEGLLDFGIKPTFIDRTTHEGQLKRSRLRPGDILTNIVGPPLGSVRGPGRLPSMEHEPGGRSVPSHSTSQIKISRLPPHGTHDRRSASSNWKSDRWSDQPQYFRLQKSLAASASACCARRTRRQPRQRLDLLGHYSGLCQEGLL